ncbi:chemotactic transducer [Pseudomonas aeruginosa]|nr:chemotactic transducer [Pseudomonas aeruginosa]
MIKSLKFSHKILLAASLVVFAAFALFTLYNDYLQRNAIREDLESYLREMGDVTSSNIQNWLGGRLLLVEQTAQTLARDHSPETVSALLEQPALTSTFSFTYLGQQDGVFTMRPDSPMPAGYDPRSRPWYKDAVAAGGLTLTEPYVDAATQELIITAATPVKAAGNTLGVVGGDLSLKTLVQIINSLDFSGMGYAFLVSGDGKILVHPDKEQVMKTLSEVYPQNTPKIATGFSEAELHGHTRILAFTPIKGLPSVTWYLALSIDKDKAYAMLSKFRVSAIAAALISIVAILVLLGLLIRLLMQPLHLMGRAMQDIAQGEGDLTKRLAVTSRDEFGVLGDAFNQFVERIHRSIREVAGTAHKLHDVSQLVVNASNSSMANSDEQSNRTNSVAAAINELGAAAQEIARNAADASHHASDAQPPGRGRQTGGRADHPRDERAFREDQRLLRQHRGPQQPHGEHRPDPRSDQGHLRADQPARPQRRHRSRARRRGRTRLRSGRRRGAQPGPSRPGVGPADPEDDRRAASRRPARRWPP